MTQVTHELGRTVIVDRGQTYSLDKVGTLRVKIEGSGGRVQWRTITSRDRRKAVLKRAAIPRPAESERAPSQYRVIDRDAPPGVPSQMFETEDEARKAYRALVEAGHSCSLRTWPQFALLDEHVVSPRRPTRSRRRVGQ